MLTETKVCFFGVNVSLYGGIFQVLTEWKIPVTGYTEKDFFVHMWSRDKRVYACLLVS
jgi:hypothetical protein